MKWKETELKNRVINLDVYTLHYYSSKVYMLKEQVRRLQQVQRQLNQYEVEMLGFLPSVTLPELTPYTWQGRAGQDFLQIREEVLRSFRDISHDQISSSLDSIQRAIHQLQQEISRYQDKVSTLREELLK